MDIKLYFKNHNRELFKNSNWEYTNNHIIIFTPNIKYFFRLDDIIRLEINK